MVRLALVLLAACSSPHAAIPDGGGDDSGSGSSTAPPYVFSQCPITADPTGATDATEAFQAALDACYALGGGVAYAPGGRYSFSGVLVVPEGVTLKGDFTPPTAANPAVAATNTVLEVTTKTTSFIQLASGSAIDSLTIWYPDQQLAASTYPPTVAVADVNAQHVHFKQRSLFSIQDVDFINSSTAIDFSPANDDQGMDEGSIQAPRVRRVYGSPLDIGLDLAGASATPMFELVAFGPEYWASSGLPNAPSRDDIAAYTRTASVGIAIGGQVSQGAHGGGAGYTTFATLEDYYTGISFYSPQQGANGTDPHLFGVAISGGTYGVEIAVGSGSMYIANSSISVQGSPNASAIYTVATVIDPDTQPPTAIPVAGELVLDEVTLASSGYDVDLESAAYSTNISGSTFSSWGTVALQLTGDAVVVQSSAFMQATSGAQVKLGAGVTSASFMSNTTIGGELVVDAPASVPVSNNPAIYPHLASLGLTADQVRQALPAVPRPARTDAGSVIVVAADTTDTTDATAAIQTALDAAAAAGGGTVYLPGGIYRVVSGACTSLHVPTGVELLGANGSSPAFPNAITTLLDAEPDPSCTAPVIALDAAAGLRGLMLWYSNQNGVIANRIHYPYAIRAGGPGDWLINLAIGNAWDGIDLASAADTSNHYIADLRGFAFDNLIDISHSTRGTILDYTFNPGYWGKVSSTTTNSILAFPVGTNNPPAAGSDLGTGAVADVYAFGSGMKLGHISNELIVNAFSHAPYTAVATYDDGGGPSFTMINLGSETYNAVHVGAVGPQGVTLVNAGGHTLSNTNYPQCNAGCNCGHACTRQAGAPYLIVDATVPASGVVTLLGPNFGAYTPIGFDLEGGTTIAQQYSCGQNAATDYQHDGLFVEAGIKTAGHAAAFISGAEFQHNFSTLIETFDASAASLGGSSVTGRLRVSGNVDLSFQP